MVSAGIAELLIFHPVDTVAKRLMSNKAKVSFSTLSPIIFRDASTATLPRKLLSLFPGLGYAAGYKVAQRVYKFGGQPWFNDIINKHYKTSFNNTFGERKGKLMMQATAGSLTGIGEVVLLPLDALKIKRQVNPEAFRGRGVVRIFLEEGTTLYRGWGWTMARNAPGSFALFGASAFTKDYVLGVSDYRKATWTQNFIASVAGAVASITIAAPLDVVKTRIQNANFEHKVHGLKVVSELVKNEGVTAFFKGLTPKLMPALPWPWRPEPRNDHHDAPNDTPSALRPALLVVSSIGLGIALTAASIAITNRFARRLRNSDWVTPDMFRRRRWVRGIVTSSVSPHLPNPHSDSDSAAPRSVGDADNFRLYHTPPLGYRWPFNFRRVPSLSKGAPPPPSAPLLRAEGFLNRRCRPRTQRRDAAHPHRRHRRARGTCCPPPARTHELTTHARPPRQGPHFGRPGQPYFAESFAWLRAAIQGRSVHCQLLRRDQYSRIVSPRPGTHGYRYH
ncbi:hypothetical protein C0993_007662 [Termitomyces sp. T159_Od127]|nr:hypothetical protein C0993_007662 [Termitomyces sp. T159_Od127]